MSFDILNRDSLRRRVETATSGKNTVLYDIKGNPSFMVVIPKMKVGDVFNYDSGRTDETEAFDFSSVLNDTHPAFKVYRTIHEAPEEVSEIFISQYHNSFVDGLPCSLPGKLGARVRFDNIDDGSGRDLRASVENKGPNWHVMNIWEYSLLQMWTYKNNLEINGEEYGYSLDSNGNSGKIEEWLIQFDTEPSFVSETMYNITHDSNIIGTIVFKDLYYHNNESYYRFFNNSAANTIDIGDEINSNEITAINTRIAEGYTPTSWRHNKFYNGVFGLISPGEVLDGIRIKNNNIEEDNGTIYRTLSIYMTLGNYRNWNENFLMNMNCSFGLIDDILQIFDTGNLIDLSTNHIPIPISDSDSYYPIVGAGSIVNKPRILYSDSTYEDYRMNGHSSAYPLSLIGLDILPYGKIEDDMTIRFSFRSDETIDDEYIYIKGHFLNKDNLVNSTFMGLNEDVEMKNTMATIQLLTLKENYKVLFRSAFI